jgi:hypothetical protein
MTPMVAIQGASTLPTASADISTSLIDIVEQFNHQPAQERLIQWFQASTGLEKQAQFALMWRNGEDRGGIDFVNVFRSYQRLPHQKIALDWLQDASHPQTLSGFVRMWQGAIAPTTNLITLVREFQNHSEQIRLIQWFQASTGEQKQREFALMWRDGQSDAPIDFVQVFRFYRGLPHQNAALQWLQQTSQPKTLQGFERMWREVKLTPSRIQLAVPFYLQTDNRYEPMRTCNTSSCAMVARFLGAPIKTDDEYYLIVRKYGDTTDHSAQTRALAHIGIRSTWHTNLGFADLDRSLEAGLPIVIGILHRGTLHSPTGGHMVVVIGRTENKDYICHDPFGSLLDPGGGYTGDPNNGRAVVYPRYILTRRWMPDGDKSGWGRLFYGN